MAKNVRSILGKPAEIKQKMQPPNLTPPKMCAPYARLAIRGANHGLGTGGGQFAGDGACQRMCDAAFGRRQHCPGSRDAQYRPGCGGAAGLRQLCLRFTDQCTAPLGAAKSIALNTENWRLLAQVNLAVNQSIWPEDDQIHYGRAEYWTIPTDGYGDCDDYAVTKRKATEHGGTNGQVDGAINLPLIKDHLAVRVNAYDDYKSGVFDRVASAGAPVSYGTHKGIGSSHHDGGSVAASLSLLDDKLVITPRYMFEDMREDGHPYADYTASNFTQHRLFNMDEPGSESWKLYSLTAKYQTPYGEITSNTAQFIRHSSDSEDSSDRRVPARGARLPRSRVVQGPAATPTERPRGRRSRLPKTGREQ